jgi:hypothetical protein
LNGLLSLFHRDGRALRTVLSGVDFVIEARAATFALSRREIAPVIRHVFALDRNAAPTDPKPPPLKPGQRVKIRRGYRAQNLLKPTVSSSGKRALEIHPSSQL